MKATKKMFLKQNSGVHSDKWAVEYTDGTERIFKNLEGGAEQLATIVDWEKVKVVAGKVIAFDI